ncbi:MAG: hypothetical protein R3E66_06350 [bacterium]
MTRLLYRFVQRSSLVVVMATLGCATTPTKPTVRELTARQKSNERRFFVAQEGFSLVPPADWDVLYNKEELFSTFHGLDGQGRVDMGVANTPREAFRTYEANLREVCPNATFAHQELDTDDAFQQVQCGDKTIVIRTKTLAPSQTVWVACSSGTNEIGMWCEEVAQSIRSEEVVEKHWLNAPSPAGWDNVNGQLPIGTPASRKANGIASFLVTVRNDLTPDQVHQAVMASVERFGAEVTPLNERKFSTASGEFDVYSFSARVAFQPSDIENFQQSAAVDGLTPSEAQGIRNAEFKGVSTVNRVYSLHVPRKNLTVLVLCTLMDLQAAYACEDVVAGIDVNADVKP